jgi:hypothetical protein
MKTNNAGSNSSTLMTWTKVVLIISAVTQFAFGAGALFSESLWNSFFMPAPLPPSSPLLLLQYFGALFLANSIGAAYAYRQDIWPAARTYLLMAGLFVGASVVLTLMAALTPPGIPLILWLYLFLAGTYLPQVVYVWLQETAREKSSVSTTTSPMAAEHMPHNVH